VGSTLPTGLMLLSERLEVSSRPHPSRRPTQPSLRRLR